MRARSQEHSVYENVRLLATCRASIQRTASTGERKCEFAYEASNPLFHVLVEFLTVITLQMKQFQSKIHGSTLSFLLMLKLKRRLKKSTSFLDFAAVLGALPLMMKMR